MDSIICNDCITKPKDKDKNNVVTLVGECYWASIVEPNTKFEPKGVWQLDLHPDKGSAKLIRELGLDIKNRGTEMLAPQRSNFLLSDGDFVRIKKMVIGRKEVICPCCGEVSIKEYERSPPTVWDAQNNPWDGRLVGNGSTVIVDTQLVHWKYQKKSGIAADLLSVKVIDLITYP